MSIGPPTVWELRESSAPFLGRTKREIATENGGSSINGNDSRTCMSKVPLEAEYYQQRQRTTIENPKAVKMDFLRSDALRPK